MQTDTRTLLAPYRGGRAVRSAWQLASTFTLFFACWLAMWWSVSVSYWLTLALALPAAGLAVRLFILQHDCGHGSLFPSRTANRLIGNCLGVLTLTPYECWRRQHALHHATNGQLDHRGIGDIHTLTVAEYRQSSRWQRFCYRLYRHPLVLFGVGPFLHFVVLQRLASRLPRHWRNEKRSVHLTNAALAVVIVAVCWFVGPWTFTRVHLPVVFLSASWGVWLFYVQHQFEPTYWQRDERWDHGAAAVQGSSHLVLPWPLSWFTANIGLHHLHHLDSRLANYSLATCYRAHPQLQTARRLTLRSSLACIRLKLWDEESQRLVSFREARRLVQ